jgi:Ca2+-binding RTX toxin-like protein
MGTDNLTGGALADTFLFAENGRFGAADVVNGGGGADIVALRGDYTVLLGSAALTGIETLSLISAFDTRFGALGADYDYDITLNDANVAAGQTFTVNGANLAANETMDIDGSAESNGILRLLAGAADDILVGGAGNDLIHGGLGADTLTGGLGNDIFRYQTADDSTATGRDGIQDFRIGDRIDLSRIDAIEGTPANDAFNFVGTAAFTNTAGELRFQNEAATIWKVQGDVDGDGTADIEFLVIVADGDPITAADFIL